MLDVYIKCWRYCKECWCWMFMRNVEDIVRTVGVVCLWEMLIDVMELKVVGFAKDVRLFSVLIVARNWMVLNFVEIVRLWLDLRGSGRGEDEDNDK